MHNHLETCLLSGGAVDCTHCLQPNTTRTQVDVQALAAQVEAKKRAKAQEKEADK